MTRLQKLKHLLSIDFDCGPYTFDCDVCPMQDPCFIPFGKYVKNSVQNRLKDLTHNEIKKIKIAHILK